MPIEIYVDHTGPMTANVSDNALLLEVLAGADGYDSRQINVKTHPYTKALQGDIKGMKIGLVTEGFVQANAEKDVNAKVRAAAKKYEAVVSKFPEFERVQRARYGLGLCHVAADDYEKAEAKFDKGVLMVRFPKTQPTPDRKSVV